MFEDNHTLNESFRIIANVNNTEYRINKAKLFEHGVNHLRIKSECNLSNVVDAVFVVDATGSMIDEIMYLRMELTDVINTVKANHPDLTLNLGSVFYRDHGDEYVTRKSELTSDVSKTIEFIKSQWANGGGDRPEAMDEALELAGLRSNVFRAKLRENAAFANGYFIRRNFWNLFSRRRFSTKS